jgi:hypothetical protein
MIVLDMSTPMGRSTVWSVRRVISNRLIALVPLSLT